MKTMQNLIMLLIDNRTKIFTILIFVLLHLTTWKLPAQEWIEPLNITNLGGYSKSPDMIVDNKGTIHIVWVYKIISNYALIMYSYSDDDGMTWAEPLDLLQNSAYLMEQPHIACDSKNNLYVTYTHDYLSWTAEGRVIKMLVFDGHQWSAPILVSEGLPGSDYNKVVVDNYDRVFVFWAYGSQFMYYRYLENGVWSDFYCPYCDSTDIFAFADGHSLSENNLHWIGASLSANYFGERLQYYLYDISTNGWSEPQMPVQDTITVGVDIALNSSGFPECVYRTYPSPDDKTKHIKKEGYYWSDPELVAGMNGSQAYQQIAIDQNDVVHVVEQQKTVEGYGLVHYKKYNEYWTGQFIDSSYIVNFPKLLFKNNQLYLVYSKTWIVEKSFVADIFFTKYDILTHIPEVKHKPAALQVFPNPTRHSVTIAFEVERQQHVTVAVLDIAGKPIKQVINTVLPSGAHSFVWNGTDNSGRPVNSGTYLVRLQTKQGSATQTVEIAR